MSAHAAWAGAVLLAALWPLGGERWRRLLPGAAWAARRRSPRGPRFRRLCAQALTRFGLTALAALLAIGRPEALVAMPPELRVAADDWGLTGTVDAWLLPELALGCALGLAIGVGAAAFWAWRGWRPRRPFGDFAQFEAGPGERGWGAVLAVTAGVTEEAYFRLALPLLATLAGLGAAAGLVGAGAVFALAHRYQGWRGVLATGVAGAGFTALYLASGSLLLAVAAHALVDLSAIVLRPWARAAALRRTGLRGAGSRGAGSRGANLF